MKLPLYQIDAFTGRLFGGNPAAVCILSDWLEAALMQAIAAENNLAETAFVVLPRGADPNRTPLEIRWFTPTVEVDLCGHATLAAAWALFQLPDGPREQVEFWSHRSGQLKCRRSGSGLTLNFPADFVQPLEMPAGLVAALGATPLAAYAGREDLLLEFSQESEVAELRPDFRQLEKLPYRGIIVTAPGNQVDFVSRFFGPAVGIDEDPVTGSAHTSLTPFWARRLGKSRLQAEQVSPRRGQLECLWDDQRVELTGSAVTYLVGEIEIPDSLSGDKKTPA